MARELWLAVRRLRRRPVHSAVVALTLGLGIGGSLAVFPVADAVLLRPLPFPAADRLVRVTTSIPTPRLPPLPYSDVAFRRLVADGRSLAAAAAFQTRDANLIGSAAPRRLVIAKVTASLFEVLRSRPALGRGFGRDEDRPNGPRVLVLSHGLWRTAFEGDPLVVGRVANIEGEPYTIVGVLGPEVAFPSREIAAWEPLQLDPASVAPSRHDFEVVARLGDGTTLEQAGRELTRSLQAVGREYPGPHSGSTLDPAGYRARVELLARELVGDARPVVVLLAVGVTMLLLLTCANVVNLQLAAVLVRGEELAVRTALGASRGRLVRDALIEGVLLSAAGAVLGLAVAVAGTRLLAAVMPPGIAFDGTLFQGRALVVTALVVLGVGAVVGAVPVALAARREVARRLGDRTGSAGSAAANRARRLLATAQVALAVLLAHGAGLLIASARAVESVRLGFRADSVLTVRINLPEATFRDRTAREGTFRRLLERVEALPGVSVAGLVNALPLTRGRRDLAMAVEGRPFKADGTDPVADYRVASTGYFEAMRIPVRQGRVFTDDDATAQNTPIVISEGLARQLFPDGEDPIGQRLRFGPVAPWMPIIGVVGDAKNRSLTEEPRPELYTPGLGTWSMLAFRSEVTLVVRTEGPPVALAPAIRRVLGEVAPEAASYDLAALAEVVRGARARMTTATRLMTGYAAAALLLAMAGSYAVLSYLVAQRRRELAVRLALGAEPRALVGLVARESATLLGIGILVGLAGAVGSARLLAALLYGVEALEAPIVIAVVVLAGLAGLLAAVIPASRAAAVPPADALRGDA